jgi:pyruvate kinase
MKCAGSDENYSHAKVVAHHQKLIFTPKCVLDTSQIVQVLNAGINVINLDLSFGTTEQHLQLVSNINEAIAKFQDALEFNIPVTKICSIKGRAPRVGRMRNDCIRNIDIGDSIVLTSDTNYRTCSLKEVCYVSNFQRLIPLLQTYDRIFLGKAVLRVAKIVRCYVTCYVVREGVLKSFERLCLPNFKNLFKEATCEEVTDCEFAIKHNFDFIIAPEVLQAEHYHILKQLIDGSGIELIAKVESNVSSLEKIQEHFFALYIDSTEINIDTVAKKAKELKKPLISSFPNEKCLSGRAIRLCEACDCFILTCNNYETAKKALKRLSNISTEIEKDAHHMQNMEEREDHEPTKEAKAKKPVLIYTSLAEKIVSSKILSYADEYRYLILLTKDACEARRLNMWRNITPMIYVDCENEDDEQQLSEMLKIGLKFCVSSEMIDNKHAMSVKRHSKFPKRERFSCTLIYNY